VAVRFIFDGHDGVKADKCANANYKRPFKAMQFQDLWMRNLLGKETGNSDQIS